MLHFTIELALLGFDERSIGIERELGLFAAGDGHAAKMAIDLLQSGDSARRFEPRSDGIGTGYPLEAAQLTQPLVARNLADVFHALAAAAEHQRQGHDVLFGADAAIGAGHRQVLTDAADNARRQRSIMENGQAALAGDGVGGDAEFETEPFLRYTTSNYKAVLLFT